MKTEILNQEAVAAWLPDRDPWGHKGDFGKLLLLCGSVGYTGAAALAARAAVRSGAGLVLLGVPEPVYTIEAVKLDEPVVFPLAAEGDGLSPAAVPEILRRLADCDACLVGPGLGRSPGVRAVTEAVLREARCPVVLDADGLNVLEGASSIRLSSWDVHPHRRRSNACKSTQIRSFPMIFLLHKPDYIVPAWPLLSALWERLSLSSHAVYLYARGIGNM